MSLRCYRIAVKRLIQADAVATAQIEAFHRGIGSANEALAAIQIAKARCAAVCRARRRLSSVGGIGAVARAFIAASPA